MAKKKQEADTPGLDFLDFLFTVAMSIGLTPELMSGQTGLLTLTNSWTKWSDVSLQARFEIDIFILALLNLILSWFGYHASIKSRPLNYSSGWGLIRFVIDVLLVIAYGVTLLKFRFFSLVLGVFTLIYITFVVWDILKIMEYWDPARVAAVSQDKPDVKKYFKPIWDRFCRDWEIKGRRKLKKRWLAIKVLCRGFRRELVSLLWALVFAALWIFWYKEWATDRSLLTLAYFSIFLYRIHKIRSFWSLFIQIFSLEKVTPVDAKATS